MLLDVEILIIQHAVGQVVDDNLVAVAVDVVPPGPDDPPVVRHARMPLVGLVRTEAADVAAVGSAG